MPNIGFSRPYAAEYINNGGTVSYVRGLRAGRGVSFEAEIETADPNEFYADNQVGETAAGRFTSGTGTLTVAERDKAFEILAQGVKEREVTIAEGVVVREIVYDEESVPPYLGVGGIIKKMVNGNILWDAFIFTKQSFNPPGDSYTTEGEEIEWQTQEWTSNIMRDDSTRHEWRLYARDLATEELADKYVRFKLGMAIEDIGTLTVTSTAGTTAGNTAITVSPAKGADTVYMYRLGNNMQLPYYDQDVSVDEGFAVWDGTAEIAASDAKQILLVEATANAYARKAGITAVIEEAEAMSVEQASARLNALAEG